MSLEKFLNTNNGKLGPLMSKITQLKIWNKHFHASLPDMNLAAHCQIVNITNNIVLALADSSHWVTRLRFYIPTILPALKKFPEFKNIQAICCKVAPLYETHSPHQPREPQNILTEETATSLRLIADRISDKKLKQSLENITRHTSK